MKIQTLSRMFFLGLFAFAMTMPAVSWAGDGCCPGKKAKTEQKSDKEKSGCDKSQKSGSDEKKSCPKDSNQEA